MESGANKVYICEPHGFIAKLAHAGVQRHTMITFEQENWARLPMNVGLSERVKDGSIAFKAGQYERAISLYTEALPPTDSVPELKVNLLANRALCYLKLGEPEAALADGIAAVRCLPDFGKGYYRMAQARGHGNIARATCCLSHRLHPPAPFALAACCAPFCCFNRPFARSAPLWVGPWEPEPHDMPHTARLTGMLHMACLA